ncbi:hypothetical protein [Ureibacillus acetophenoni]|uniref:Uncharacterized protein n=1 Tax=Ureibacillus acetophenoni TaxID=614649 RepID=A0A285URJ4_9BACL|nr:hypothetical protein [Ureibacillus acetophenoni]SOC44452.1 hypothetical protein SAMN05877842_12030 [Ureibacillus acetophenoni]
MNQYQREELNLISQSLLSILLISIFAYCISFISNTFPWQSLLGFGIGLSIIVICWIGRRSYVFISFLLLYTVVYSIAYNFSAFFSVH